MIILDASLFHVMECDHERNQGQKHQEIHSPNLGRPPSSLREAGPLFSWPASRELFAVKNGQHRMDNLRLEYCNCVNAIEFQLLRVKSVGGWAREGDVTTELEGDVDREDSREPP